MFLIVDIEDYQLSGWVRWLFYLSFASIKWLEEVTLASKQAFFCCLNLVIALQSAVLWLFLSQ
jgi:hypothetical protein